MTADAGDILLPIARAAIANALGRKLMARDDAPWLQEAGASFVTLTSGGQLRGCIGTLQPQRRLLDDVRDNAVGAALRDPRFAPVAPDELDRVLIGVSLLSAMQAMHFRDEDDALAQLRPGIDGLLFECEGRRSTFLPQVWEQLPAPAAFVGQLKRKAGFPTHFWDGTVRLHRYTVAKWEEPESLVTSQNTGGGKDQ